MTRKAFAATVAILVFAAAGAAQARVATSQREEAGSVAMLRGREARQADGLWKYQSRLRFFTRHQELLWTGPLRRRAVAKQLVRNAKLHVAWRTRELAETRAGLRAALDPWPVPGWFWAPALCVHRGEGSWRNVGMFGGGMQFLPGTWNEAAGYSRGRLPYVSSTAEIAQQPPKAQVYASYLIVQARGHWGDWPNTARACGLPTG